MPVTVAVSKMGLPKVVMAGVTIRPVVLGAIDTGSIVTITAAETLGPLLGSPPYVAVIEWLPTASVLDVNVAAPDATDAVPSVVLPSLNVTVPVGLLPLTVAVNVTGWLNGARVVEAMSVVVETPPNRITRARRAVVAQLPVHPFAAPPER